MDGRGSANYLPQRGATHFGHVVVVKKLRLTIVPLDLHARPIGTDDRALIGRAVMPSDALADFELFGLVGSHDAMLRHEDGRCYCRLGLKISEYDLWRILAIHKLVEILLNAKK
jgi:hypothetical protein